MALLRRLIRLVPETVRTELIQRVRAAAAPTGGEIISCLYLPEITETSGGTEIPWKITPAGRKIACNRPALAQSPPYPGLPVAPRELRQGDAPYALHVTE